MNLPYSWLQQLLPGAPSVEVIADILPQLGFGVEDVHELSAPPAGVVVARIEAAERIEGSDHLTACTVSDGSASYSVVCGAPNVRVGMRSALVKPGTHLPAIDLDIGERKVMGVLSQGMLASPKELGLYDYGGGIIAFGEDTELGAELSKLWPAETVLEVEITPNRADAFSVLGLARDLGAKLGLEVKEPWAGLDAGDPAVDDGLTVKVEDADGCPRFTLRRISGVNVGPSPVWLMRRLASVGLRPRNNVVDVTNFVTFETGHPSHAYDLDMLNDNTIVVRRAEAGETVLTLNDEVLELTPDDLAITTPEGSSTKVVGLAGVIGGKEDSIHPTTQTVALELAHWNPVLIRKTAKRHGVSTDAHYRFERGVDPNLPLKASARAAQLIADLAGGVPHVGVTDTGADKPPVVISYRPERVHYLMDVDIPEAEQRRHLEALGFEVDAGQVPWQVKAPSWRFDMAIEEDLIEEVSRLHGYEHIGESAPDMLFVPEEADTTHRKLKLVLAGLGLQEVITYIFTSEAELKRSAAPPPKVRLSSPQGIERSVLRTALYPSLLNVAALNRSAENVSIFEVGHVFGESEEERLGILLRGVATRGGWQPDRGTDFYHVKGLLEKLAATLGVAVRLEPVQVPFLHPGVAARVLWDSEDKGVLGRLHPRIEAELDLPETFIAELAMPLVGRELSFADFSRQPFAERDLAFVVPEALSFAELQALVSAAAGERLESVSPFDIYRGEAVGEGQKSAALRFRFRDEKRALRDDEVDGYMANIIAAAEARGYTIRA